MSIFYYCKMKKSELKSFLEEKANQYENVQFIDSDSIQIPHSFSKKEDIEIAGFLSSTIAWGNRKMIINNAKRMMTLLGNSPYDFIINHQEKDLQKFDGFVHRTFNADDFRYFVVALQNIYKNHGGLENTLKINDNSDNYKNTIADFKSIFFELEHLKRTEKHVSNPLKKSASKRINMFLRWMVRSSDRGVDFGIWKEHHPKNLHCPLDVHTGNIARKIGILTRKQNDWKALEELDEALREFNPEDPVKYDFALFGLGVFENF